jgi:HlyD family secretion protein
VIESGRARLRPVEAGVQDEQFREIRSGLVPGDTVALFPGSGVNDGKKIAVLR